MISAYFRFVLFALAMLSLPISGQIRAAEYVVPNPSAPTLTAAVQMAKAGDQLLIKPGVYREHLIISKPLALRPVPGDTDDVILDGQGQGRVVHIRSANVTLRGLTLRGSGDNIEQIDACVYVHDDAHHTQLLDNNMAQCLFGIWVNGAHHAVIAGNVIKGIFKRIFSDRGNGINLWNVRHARVERNEISEVRDGIYLSVSTDSLVAENLLYHLRFGIHYMYNDRNRIIDNITCDSQVGLAMMFSKQLDIRGNMAYGNRDHGILLRTIVESRIRQNRSVDNAKGFFFNDASFNEFTENDARNNRIGVHVTAGSEANRVFRNNFINNTVQVRFSQREQVFWGVTGDGNFWSDYLGWDMNRDGQGDRRYYSAHRMDTLIHRYPQVKLLAASPVVQLLQVLESRFPVLRPPGIVERHPAMRPIATPTRVSPLVCVTPTKRDRHALRGDRP